LTSVTTMCSEPGAGRADLRPLPWVTTTVTSMGTRSPTNRLLHLARAVALELEEEVIHGRGGDEGGGVPHLDVVVLLDGHAVVSRGMELM